MSLVHDDDDLDLDFDEYDDYDDLLDNDEMDLCDMGEANQSLTSSLYDGYSYGYQYGGSKHTIQNEKKNMGRNEGISGGSGGEQGVEFELGEVYTGIDYVEDDLTMEDEAAGDEMGARKGMEDRNVGGKRRGDVGMVSESMVKHHNETATISMQKNNNHNDNNHNNHNNNHNRTTKSSSSSHRSTENLPQPQPPIQPSDTLSLHHHTNHQNNNLHPHQSQHSTLSLRSALADVFYKATATADAAAKAAAWMGVNPQANLTLGKDINSLRCI